MVEVKTRMDKGGRVVVPAAFRKALELKPGDEVRLVLEEGQANSITLLVTSATSSAKAKSKAQGPTDENEARRKRIAAAIEQAQAVVAKYVPEGRSLSEELIQERRQEAANE